ncbi:MAG: hypothetical protein WA711_13765, partial [Pseudolabrys sp.]
MNAHGGIIDARSAPSSGYIHEVEDGNNTVFGNNDNRAVLVDCVIGVFQFWHSLRQNCRKIQQSVFGNRITNFVASLN